MDDTTNPDRSSVSPSVRDGAVTYEQKLEQDLGWAMDEGSRHFEEKSAVHATLGRICHRLNELEIPYAVVGGMALFKYGYRRFTEDVDILVTRESLTRIHQELDGLGYSPVFAGSKNLRDTQHNVKIEFLIAGEYPGDGKPKQVVFPDPLDVVEPENDIRYLGLNTLIELKMASGMTGQDRMKDLVDVQELIRILSLPQSLSQELSPYVQTKFDELWQAANSGTRRYMKLWQIEFLAENAVTIDEVIDELENAMELLRQMRADGVEIASTGRADDGTIRLITTDPEIAKKYGMHDEREFLGDA